MQMKLSPNLTKITPYLPPTSWLEATAARPRWACSSVSYVRLRWSRHRHAAPSWLALPREDGTAGTKQRGHGPSTIA
ncbi:hypothetical protein GQ55_5G268800 [Panicum hallii var. hallii]|uniref:Uncharacterized protein n=1 Tax=Panicum hallii var. hallii TaxID=1504633 RepID=A0A2T7DKI7_9POAL|nr:hypothetical protein GQ55_5G268800 [Panicum hallii var. hallii]